MPEAPTLYHQQWEYDGGRLCTSSSGPMVVPEHAHPEVQVAVCLPEPSHGPAGVSVMASMPPHGGELRGGERFVMFTFGVAASETTAIDMGLPLGVEGRERIADPLLHRIAFAVHGELQKPTHLTGPYLESAASFALLHVLRQFGDRPVVSRRFHGLSQGELRTVLERMRASGLPSPSVSDLAGLVHRSPSAFIRAFRAATGTTPHQHLLALKLYEARVLLRRRDLSVGQIATMLGFSSQSHFGAAFRRQYGVSPSEYRRVFR